MIRLALTTIFVVACIFSSVIVFAAVQIFDGKGEWHTSDAENQQIAMARASQRARLDAQKKAGIYLKTFSRSVNLELVDDEISAVTNNIIEIVGDVHFDKKIIPLSDNQTTILYTATLKAKIDPEGIYDFVKREDKNKVAIIQQNTQLQDEIQKNDELAASLTDQYNKTTSQAKKDQIRKQMNQTDRDFLANQKLEEGFKLYYVKNYHGAIKLCNEAIQFNTDLAEAYAVRGLVYFDLEQYEKAISEFNKTLKLKPSLSYVYIGRASAYGLLNQHSLAFNDFSKAIQLNPNLSEAYIGRGFIYTKELKKYELAIDDFNRAIQLNPNSSNAYIGLGITYIENTKQYDLAIINFSKAIQLNPNYDDAYACRGLAYALTGSFTQAISDFTQAIKLNSNNANAYKMRGACYYKLREMEKSQSDFAKARQLGWKD